MVRNYVLRCSEQQVEVAGILLLIRVLLLETNSPFSCSYRSKYSRFFMHVPMCVSMCVCVCVSECVCGGEAFWKSVNMLDWGILRAAWKGRGGGQELKSLAQQWSNPFKNWNNLRVSSVVNMPALENRIDIYLKQFFSCIVAVWFFVLSYEESKDSSFTVQYLNYLKIGLDHCCAQPFNCISVSFRCYKITFQRVYTSIWDIL